MPWDKVYLHHRNLKWLGWEISSSSNPAMGRDTFHCTRLLKALSNLALNPAKGWGVHNLPGQPVPVTNLTVKNFFLTSNLFFLFVPMAPCPITTIPEEDSSSGFMVGPFRYQNVARLLHAIFSSLDSTAPSSKFLNLSF